MIDLHMHILPGLDDGPETMEEAVAMARSAHAAGITQIVASPHAFNGIYWNDTIRVEAKVVELQAELIRKQIPVEILPGMEVHLHLQVADQYKSGNVLTINDSRYMLIELPTQQIPVFADDVLFGLMVIGVIPVIVHPERNRDIQRDPNVLGRYIDNGMLAVIAAGSLTGMAGRETRETAKALLRHNLAQAMASDAHGVNKRPQVLSEGVRAAAKIMGEAAARKLVDNIPGRIVRNSPINGIEPKIWSGSGLLARIKNLFG